MQTALVEVIEDWLFKEQRSRAQLTRIAGIGEAMLSRVMKGKQKPSAHMLKRLELAMGLPLGTLVALQAQAPLPLDGEAQAGEKD